jgi:hypothetical protein
LSQQDFFGVVASPDRCAWVDAEASFFSSAVMFAVAPPTQAAFTILDGVTGTQAVKTNVELDG